MLYLLMMSPTSGVPLYTSLIAQLQSEIHIEDIPSTLIHYVNSSCNYCPFLYLFDDVPFYLNRPAGEKASET